MLRPGDHVVTSVVDHNSVLRPLRFLAEQRGIQVDYVPCDGDGVVDPQAVRRALRPHTRLIALVHASNVTGALQPIEEVGQIAAEHGVLYLVDAAQSLGHLPIDVRRSGSTFPGGAGAQGAAGTLRPGHPVHCARCEAQLLPLRQGGTGTQSDEDRQPDTLPDKYEPGNLNVPAVLGLGEGIAYLEQMGLEQVQRHAQALDRAPAGRTWRRSTGVTVYGPRDARRQVGVVSISLASVDPRVVAAMLDTTHRIQVRAGIQCAPLDAPGAGDDSTGGTVRLSTSVFTTRTRWTRPWKPWLPLPACKVEA